ncbi:SDR family oxidoreductase [Beijerinckia sp. L45]|uniref:SDR family oxidoreductase n=1 Tax=Beijerinckia sp. L45 TaxID=1641855 RepID=UPI00131CA0F3|nr:SDR family oxidoreductase [Beijerinckia sp. L45]
MPDGRINAKDDLVTRTASSKGNALVTGASRRIGSRIATRLAEAGFDVALHASARSRDKAEGLAATLVGLGVRSCVMTGDLADAARCASLIAEARQRLGPLCLLVNNAAIFESDSAEAVDLDLWDRQFAVNLRAPVLLSRDFAAQAVPGDDASIVNLIDQRVLRPTPQYFSYTLAKSALWTATRTMAQAFAERGVRVNAIGPGPVLPNANEGSAGFSKEVEGVPLHRAVEPDEIAAAVLYLAGARAVTGQMIAVDAGQHLGWRTPDVVE